MERRSIRTFIRVTGEEHDIRRLQILLAVLDIHRAGRAALCVN